MSGKKRVATALSGGVDSAVCALLLKNQGYEVIGITGKMVNDDNFETVCNNAKAVAKKLEIEHHILDLSEQFQKNIIDYFINSYKNGETPNPCIVCNKTIKWGSLFDYAMNNLHCDFIATGHYANIAQKDGQFLLYPAKDTKKDQLYYLFELNQEQLSRTFFPLSAYEKSQIREIALKNDLPSKSAKESQDICFIKKPYTTKKFLFEHIMPNIGDFILLKTGEIIGHHNGFFQYTIGQRKGIGIAYKEPLYVVGINAEKNQVLCGTKDELSINNLTLKNPNLHDKKFFEQLNTREILVKVRYNMPFAKAIATFKNNELSIEFKSSISAPAKGQACVLYDPSDGHLIGGKMLDNF